MKCDVIIPVYKAPEWVKLCVYALFTNTDPKLINKVYLINDCNDTFTKNCLKNLKKKYGSKVVLKQNDKNLGFIKTVNHGLKLSTADYVLLLNSDCLLAKNTIGKLIAHLQKDSQIGLICPLASNAANITLPIPEGWSYTQIDQLLETKFLGQNFDACTVVGNCLMITRECIKKTGQLDESYGTGYGEETDYQFKAMQKGFSAKVAIDTYVFHKAEASFGTSKEKQARLQKNRDLFFSRWGEQYHSELEKYNRNDPIKYIKSHIDTKEWQSKVDTLFYIDGIVQNAGGVHTVVDIVNYLTINGESINILFNLQYPYQESMLFTPIPSSHVEKVQPKQIVSTVWKTAFAARKIADEKHAKLLSFVQGYEAYFENGNIFGGVETSYKLADDCLTISKFLQRELKDVFNKRSTVVPNTINYDLIHSTPNLSKVKTLTIILRDNPMKGDWLLLDIIKHLSLLKQKLKINIVAINEFIMLPNINDDKIEINLIKGPQKRNTIYQLLQKSDIYVDASLSEGFGLTALEAMSAGCVPIVSNSIGVKEYLKNNHNGILINNVNDVYAYIDAIEKLLTDGQSYDKLAKNGQATAARYDFDTAVHNYINYFHNTLNLDSQRQSPTPQDQKIIDAMCQERIKHAKKIAAFEIVKKLTPKPIKAKTVSLIDKLYRYMH